MGRHVEIEPGVRVYRPGWRSHMERRPDETREQHNHRLSHSCYRCGHYEPDDAILDPHEETCTGTSPATEERSRPR
ncbi:hypothetical protein FHX42_003700 [Saccharopolyspora lacisalsi]|uniref:Uncharacterized protein n=1 Tax=Halosaccharopolyspora lacisalsi TaxID=1000566 RepID=A0A839DXV9_9PSEU|nr:hypothetical protein [Halosaccharopolyspora lacisalsi]MBA8826324.1 hypothetical protein [Halosaccharopolyspora lacisalsi]